MIRRSPHTVTFLASVAVLILVIGCSGGGDKALFSIEKLFYNAEKVQDTRLGIKPELATDADYQAVIDAYMDVVESYESVFPGTADKDSLTETEAKATYMAGRSLLQTARLYQSKGELDKTIEILRGYSARFPRNREHKALALLQLGKIEEEEGNIDEAEKAYVQLLEEFYPPSDRELHPNTDILELPVKLAKLHAELENDAKKKEFLDYAENYYGKIIEDFRYSPLGLTTTRFLADTYVLTGRPREAIDLLETVTDSAGTIFGTAQLLIANIYGASLGDTNEARRRYEIIIADEGDSMLHPNAYMQLAKLEFLKKDFVKCRSYTATIKERFERYPAVQAMAQELVAQSFDLEGDFNRAYSEYQWLMTNYPESKETINAYRYLPGFLKINGQDNLALEWYGKAVDFLAEKRKNSAGTFFGLTSAANLVNLYIDYEKWGAAIDELSRLQSDYPSSRAGAQALAKAGNIALEKLEDERRARELYEAQVNLYPDLPITEKARLNLESLGDVN